MNKCKTCAHFDDSPEPENHMYIEGAGTCKCNKFLQGCHHKPLVDEIAFCYDESGSFHPGPEFGCVHHMERP
jgi:hypothetical protein